MERQCFEVVLPQKKPQSIRKQGRAGCSGIPVELSANELITRTETEKAKLLIARGKAQMPHPLSFKDNWLCESGGLTSWPLTFLSDITVFLMKEHPGKDVDLHQRVLNKYRKGKAFRLFDSRFLKEVKYNGVSVDSDYCFMKVRCTLLHGFVRPRKAGKLPVPAAFVLQG